jgi:hypothetical protein
MGFEPNTLRIWPTAGIAGQPVTITVEGSWYYVGALYWIVSLGSAEVMNDPPSGECSLKASFTPAAPGIYPVLVAYGGKPMNLAGFYTASAGATDPPTIQPGYPCTPAAGANVCAEGGTYSCACVDGRCQCKSAY